MTSQTTTTTEAPRNLPSAPISNDPSTLNKSVFGMVMRPPENDPSEPLTAFQLLIFQAMIKKAKDYPGQAHVVYGGESFYRISLNEIAVMFGMKRAELSTKDVKPALERLMDIRVNFEPTSNKDSMRLEHHSSDSGGESDVPEVFAPNEVLAQVLENGVYVEKKIKVDLKARRLITGYDWVQIDGERTVLFHFDRTVEPFLLGQVPGIPYAQLDFLVYGAIKGAAARRLYEIVVRTKDTGSGSTGYKHWTWWVEALTFRPTTGPHHSKTYKEFRYFKARVLGPSIQEINKNSAMSGFTVEMLEPKRGPDKKISDIAFRLIKNEAQSLEAALPASRIDPAILMRSERLSIAEGKAEKLIKKYGAQEFVLALESLEQMLAAKANDPTAEPIRSNHGYVQGILKKRSGVSEPPRPAAAKPQQQPAPAPKPAAAPQSSNGVEINPRRAQVDAALEAMTPEELDAYGESVYQSLPDKDRGLVTRARNSKNWRFALLWIHLVNHKAVEMFGPNWQTNEQGAEA